MLPHVSQTRRPLAAVLLALFMLHTCTTRAQQSYRGDGADDWLRLVPVASALTLKACGVESRSSWPRLVVNTAMSYALGSAVTWGLKHGVTERRPDWTDRRSFPSGHAMVAFAGAAVVDREYRQVSPWISVAAYTVATGVAVDRVARHRHHWHDVAAGAAVGVGSTLLGYYLADKVTGWGDRCTLSVGPGEVTMVIGL